MKPSRPLVSIDTREQEPLACGHLTITPQTQLVTLRLPGLRWRWIRPQALLIQDGETLDRVTIPDRTRVLWLAALSMAAGAWVIALAGRVKRGSCLAAATRGGPR